MPDTPSTDIEVEVEPLVGEVNTPLGPRKIEKRVMMIFASNEFLRSNGTKRLHVGYVDKAPGSPINWLPAAREIPEDMRDEIAAKVTEAMDGDAERKQFGPPPPLPVDDGDEVIEDDEDL